MSVGLISNNVPGAVVAQPVYDHAQVSYHYLATPPTRWQTIVLAGGVDDADNAGGDIVNPLAIARLEQGAGTGLLLPLLVAGKGVSVLVRMKYVGAVTTPPVVQMFGVDGSIAAGGVPMRLLSAGGNIDEELTAAATDLTDGTSLWTAHKTFSCLGALWVFCAIKTAGDGASKAAWTVEAKVI